jgi:hypothetical protein
VDSAQRVVTNSNRAVSRGGKVTSDTTQKGVGGSSGQSRTSLETNGSVVVNTRVSQSADTDSSVVRARLEPTSASAEESVVAVTYQ